MQSILFVSNDIWLKNTGLIKQQGGINLGFAGLTMTFSANDFFSAFEQMLNKFLN